MFPLLTKENSLYPPQISPETVPFVFLKEAKKRPYVLIGPAKGF
jgi:hypothetical protein